MRYGEQRWVDVEQISATGALLHPELASADKGERILEAVANEIVACVREISSWQPLSPA